VIIENDLNTTKVGIIMGSDSDLPIMTKAAQLLKKLGVGYEVRIISAHRTPDLLYNYAKNVEERGIQVIIAGAGGAAHLPGMVASLTSIPVIGVPVKSSSLDGMDSVLSIAQMPAGVPVGTVGINSAHNAGLLAARILSIADESLKETLKKHKPKEYLVKAHTEHDYRHIYNRVCSSLKHGQH
jgi:5-(carboxyamino)imidazole ribonucleotide mutase